MRSLGSVALVGRRREFLPRELAHRLEQAEARGGQLVPARDAEEGALAERLEVIERRRAEVRQDGLAGLGGEAATKDREPRQSPPFGRVEELPRPFERAAERGLTRRSTAPRGEELELAAEPRHHPFETEELEPRGGELDRERDALQPLDERRDGVGQRRIDRVAAMTDAIEEQLDRLGQAGTEHPEGLELDRGLGGEAGALARRRDPHDLGGRPDPEIQRRGRVGEDLLEVVDDEQGPTARGEDPADLGGELDPGRGGGEAEVERARDDAPERVGVVGLGELADDDAGESVFLGSGHLEREPGLAHPGRAPDRHQARATFDQRMEPRELVPSSDQPRRVAGAHATSIDHARARGKGSGRIDRIDRHRPELAAADRRGRADQEASRVDGADGRHLRHVAFDVAPRALRAGPGLAAGGHDDAGSATGVLAAVEPGGAARLDRVDGPREHFAVGRDDGAARAVRVPDTAGGPAVGRGDDEGLVDQGVGEPVRVRREVVGAAARVERDRVAAPNGADPHVAVGRRADERHALVAGAGVDAGAAEGGARRERDEHEEKSVHVDSP